MTRNTAFLSAALLAALFLNACKKDKVDPSTPSTPPVNEEELITTLRLHLRSTGGTQDLELLFRDIDGDGGTAPVIEADALSTDTVYNVEIAVLNESVTPPDVITEEIEEEGDAHQFFFQVTGADVSTAYTDADANGQPIGINSTWTAGAASTGNVTVTLRHQPVKDAAGVSSGDITNAGGETDIEVTFPLTVQ
ncbi:MAG TPA: type 1 periplasmic binding fold superfamily protein [Flavobacteriales bacterium]